jgi:hypothetical protein
MKAIYIKNYLNLPNEEKEDFLRFLQQEEALPVKEQKMVFAESSLVLTFEDNTDMQQVKKMIDAFFERSDTQLTTYIVRQITSEGAHSIITLNHRKLRIK